jgi:hypothetical protein
MAADEEFEVEVPDTEVFADGIAERASAYVRLLDRVDMIRDKALRAEGMSMLKALRTSFKSHPGFELVALPGGKNHASERASTADKPL